MVANGSVPGASTSMSASWTYQIPVVPQSKRMKLRSLSRKLLSPTQRWEAKALRALVKRNISAIRSMLKKGEISIINIDTQVTKSSVGSPRICSPGSPSSSPVVDQCSYSYGSEVLGEKLHRYKLCSLNFEEGDTLLILAVRNRCFDIAGLLIAAGANVNYKNSSNATALIVACKLEHTSQLLASSLVNAGAEINHTDFYGKTALDYVADRIFRSHRRSIDRRSLQDNDVQLHWKLWYGARVQRSGVGAGVEAVKLNTLAGPATSSDWSIWLTSLGAELRKRDDRKNKLVRRWSDVEFGDDDFERLTMESGRRSLASSLSHQWEDGDNCSEPDNSKHE